MGALLSYAAVKEDFWDESCDRRGRDDRSYLDALIGFADVYAAAWSPGRAQVYRCCAHWHQRSRAAYPWLAGVDRYHRAGFQDKLRYAAAGRWLSSLDDDYHGSRKCCRRR